MKTASIILLITILGFSTKNLAGQGVVFFGNRPLPGPPLGPDRLVRAPDGTPTAGTNFLAQLLYQDNTGMWVAHPLIAAFYDTSVVALGGYWVAGSRSLQGAGGIDVPVSMQIRAWDSGSGGTTFEEAIVAGRQWGVSEVFIYTERDSILPNQSDKWMWEFQGFQLVPEPSTWALLAVGAGFLFWRWRRRK